MAALLSVPAWCDAEQPKKNPIPADLPQNHEVIEAEVDGSDLILFVTFEQGEPLKNQWDKGTPTLDVQYKVPGSRRATMLRLKGKFLPEGDRAAFRLSKATYLGKEVRLVPRVVGSTKGEGWALVQGTYAAKLDGPSFHLRMTVGPDGDLVLDYWGEKEE